MKTILGIDNGLYGALSFYDGSELLIYDMPLYKTERPSINISRLLEIITTNAPNHAYIEKLTPMPRVGGLPCFSMGHSEGIILASMTALKTPFTFTRPSEWKKAMQCPADKDAARKRATELLPNHSHNWPLKKHDGRAESALIALYGYNKTTP